MEMDKEDKKLIDDMLTASLRFTEALENILENKKLCELYSKHGVKISQLRESGIRVCLMFRMVEEEIKKEIKEI